MSRSLPPRVRGKKRDRPLAAPAGRKPPRPRPPKRASKLTPKDVVAAIQNDVRPVRASLGYRIVALIAAAVALLLPIAYLALIAAVGWATYYHFAEHTALLSAGRGRLQILAVLLYLSPGLAGAAVILALLKPLAAPQGGRSQWRVLHRTNQPTLFVLIDRVCDAVNAPKPDQVRVDAEVNMSAGYQGGFLGLFGGKFVLTIGVPLTAGLSAAGFAGILAHEFGHFAQRGGRGLSGAAMSVQSWLIRTVFKRDRVDEWIAEGCSADSWIALPFWLCAACVWLARRALILLLYVARASTAALSRQMEFDADRYETRLVGADVFADSSRRLIELSLGYRGAMSELVPALLNGAPPDDLTALCVHHAPRLSEEEACELEQELRGGGLFDTLFVSHPTTARRLAAARREGERLEATGGPGLTLDGPAMHLFGDFAALCRDVTLDNYRAMLGRRPNPNDLAPVRPLPPNPHRPTGSQPKKSRRSKRVHDESTRPAEDSAASSPDANDEEIDAPSVRLLPYERAHLEAPTNEKAHLARLKQRRADADAAEGPLRDAVAKLHKVGERRRKIFARHAGAAFRPAAHAEAGADLFTLRKKLNQAELAREEAELAVRDWEQAPADARLLALDLYAAPGVAAKLPDHVLPGIEELLTFACATREARPAVRDMQDAAVRLQTALRAASGENAVRGVVSEIETRHDVLSGALQSITKALLGVTDPFTFPTEPLPKPDRPPRPLTDRLSTLSGLAAGDPMILLSSAARCLHELRAAADHADLALAARADWIVGRLKLDAAPSRDAAAG
ncbi:M48 family metallopeptidase [Alienimonas chondri]|uniref:Peptidase M48 domain-containing protein n=1 Tax=Alienimonas chondri TaxID=2681879 RepID=A0ABX1VH87_9PLAN|nr:M48 family metallopeptidase [Alienimonas chondri]NNJ27477.1 hypothetical protein [Alienimonas chondri]